MSKFFEFRPQWCVLAGDPGTVNQCLCIVHENPRLMLEALDLSLTCEELMAKLVCSLDNVSCCMFISDPKQKCKSCPKDDDALYDYFMENILDEQVSYPEWVSTEGVTQIVTTTQHVIDFIPKMIGVLKKLVTHRFINKSQNEYFKEIKNDLRNKDCILLLDFAENYSSVTQNEVQAAHFSKKQHTLHPFVVYYRGEDVKVTHKSYCVLTEYLKHDAESVHTFIRELIPQLKELIPGLEKMHIFSDGGPAHYKNKYNFANLSFFLREYDFQVEWNFWAPGHGKNACDGIGGSTKRLFRLASLRGETLKTTQQLFDWAKKNIPAVTFMLISKQAVEENYILLEPRMKKAARVTGTRQFFQYVPGPIPGILMATELSNHSLPRKKFVVVPSTFIPIGVLTIRFGDFLVVSFEDDWWIARVDFIQEMEEELTVTFFGPKGSECISGKGFSMITPKRKEAVNSSDVIFNLRATAVRRSKASKFYDITDDVFKEIKTVIEDFNLFKLQQ